MNLLRTLAKVSSLTMLSRILGFVRDAVIARIFGAGLASDAFFVAFKLPNLLRRIFAEGAFSQAFVPVLTEFKTTRSHEETVTFTQYIAGFLSFILFWVSLAGILGASYIIWVSAPGFKSDQDKFQLAVQLLQIIFPYIFFISLSSFVSGILNTYNKFSVPAFTPVFLNLSFIFFVIFLTPYFNPPVITLAVAVLVGGFLQFAWQLPFLAKLGFFRFPKIDFKNKNVNRVLKLMLPAILGVSVSQISLVINTIFASFLPTGSVSWLYYADRLMELPSGVLGAALGTILLPTLSKQASLKDNIEFSKLMDWGIRLILLLTLPAAVGMAVLSFPIVATLFMYREFNLNDAIKTAPALIAYGSGLTGIILIKVLAPAFYAHQNTKTPVKIAVFTLILTQAMNLAFIVPLKHVGLALSISIAALVNAFILYYTLRKKKIYVPQFNWAPYVLKVIIATTLMGALLYYLDHQSYYPIVWQDIRGVDRVIHLFALIFIGVVVYFSSLRIMGVRLHHFRKVAK